MSFLLTRVAILGATLAVMSVPGDANASSGGARNTTFNDGLASTAYGVAIGFEGQGPPIGPPASTTLRTGENVPNGLPSHTMVAMAARPLDPAQTIRQWERNMVEYGNQWGQALLNATDYQKKFKLRYYDAQRVHEQIAKYLGETQPWYSYSQSAEDNYKTYLENADFRTQGWQRFPHGLYLDWKRTGDSQSREYLVPLRDKPPFSDPISNSYADAWVSQTYSREVAYSIQSQIIAERAGYPRQAQRLSALVNLALGHVDIWVTQNYVNSDSSWHYTQPFMAGLTASALIEYYERSVKLGNPDPRIIPALKRLGNYLWDNTWVDNVNGTGYGAFVYKNTGNDPAPDLNQLVAPMFGWLYYQTGEERWLQRGDKIFAGGVVLADLGSGKRFNQQYRSSFRYVGWRTRAVSRYGN